MSSIILRFLLVVASLVVWYWSQNLIARKANGAQGIGDAVHGWTERWHRFFQENTAAANRALFVSSLGIDVLGLSLIVFSIFGRSFAPFLGMLIVFSLRQISQLCCTLPPPPGIIWRNPGFPSLLVTYEVGNDFFFSGHTALAVLGALQMCHFGPWWLGGAAILLAFGEGLIVLVLRAHYTLDVIAGALAAWFAFDLASRFAPTLDNWLR
ncbi:MAG: phosphatase PAP2 family protein [Verrucomicrobiales bacterium]|nr:phosphatase PAP2 family protein [Verrucomicrobiales bacterium]